MSEQTQSVQRTKLCQKEWVLRAKRDGFNNTFIPFNESILLGKKKKKRKTQGKGDFTNATSLHLVGSHSLGRGCGMMDKSAQLVLLGGLDWAWWLQSLCLGGHWVHLQHTKLSPVSMVNSLHNSFRLAYFWSKKSLCCHSKTALFAMKRKPVVFLLLAFLQDQGTPMNVPQSTNFPPCLSRLLVLKGWPVDLQGPVKWGKNGTWNNCKRVKPQ